MNNQSITHSEGREWVVASLSIAFVWLLCVLFIKLNSLNFNSQSLSSFYFIIQFLFLLIGLYSLYLLFQGYYFRNGRAVLSKKNGIHVLNSIKKSLNSENINLFEDNCVFAPSFGFWTSIGRLQFEEGEVEIKEIWLNRFFFRTQIAIRGIPSFDKLIINSIKDTSFSVDLN
ncbi:MAG: hypothetical protein BEU04_01905 [Marine Group III euryarchaeote CG-Bathy1]|uniref:Uncharacterized protein n=1 Tax=Marine Group III euryarchaeote CG-Bathy1 TaxID=1889001 RepID=A0A1J5THA6_9ARCH|nr:MAG: hypothetical protein BEU04_01905 [Marine Group III euryarchaeote CG-Bathy1]